MDKIDVQDVDAHEIEVADEGSGCEPGFESSGSKIEKDNDDESVEDEVQSGLPVAVLGVTKEENL